jgi:two-component system, sensor histidine kinase LadS
MKSLFLFLYLFFSFQICSKELNSVKYYCDTSGKITLNQLVTKKLTPFTEGKILQIGMNKNASVWCVFDFKNSTNIYKKTWISFPNIHLDSLVFFENGEIKRITGDRTKSKEHFSTSFSYFIKIHPKSSKKIIVKIKKLYSFLEFQYKIENNNLMLFYNHTRNLVFSTVFIGLISALILLNIILYSVTYSKIYIYYVAYSILTLFYLVITTGFAKYFLFTNFIYLSEFRVYTGSFWIILLFYFYSELLSLKENLPLIYRIIMFCSLANILNMLSTAFVDKIDNFIWVSFLWKAGYCLFLIQGIALCYAIFRLFKNNKKITIYIGLSFIPHFVWFIGYILRSFKIVFYEQNFEWLLVIALYEAILFGFILSYNYISTFVKNKELHQEVESIQQQTSEIISTTKISERRSIANLIHDHLGSHLFYLNKLSHSEKKEPIQEQLKELTKNLRNLSHQILPKSLDDGDLCESISQHLTLLTPNLTNIELIFQSNHFPNVKDYPWKYDMYLITLEFINNSLKHADCDQIMIDFYRTTESYIFQFTDNGKGFDVTNQKKGFGLTSIQTRVSNYGGDFKLVSDLGFGTTLTIKLNQK